MLRLTPHGYNRLVQADDFEAVYGGAEANVAAALANWGEYAAFVSKVPAHEIGQGAVNALRRCGVETRFLLRGGEYDYERCAKAVVDDFRKGRIGKICLE